MGRCPQGTVGQRPPPTKRLGAGRCLQGTAAAAAAGSLAAWEVPMAQRVVANKATSAREGLWIEPRALLPTCRILTRFTPQYYSLVGHSGARRFLFLLLNETSVPHAQGPFEPIIATDVTAHYNTRRREVVVQGEGATCLSGPPNSGFPQPTLCTATALQRFSAKQSCLQRGSG